MFTVLIKNGPTEELFSAESFNLLEGSDKPQNYDDRVLWCAGYNDTGEIKRVGAGEVYIMNQAGRTVASYRLGVENPHGVFRDPIEGVGNAAQFSDNIKAKKAA